MECSFCCDVEFWFSHSNKNLKINLSFVRLFLCFLCCAFSLFFSSCRKNWRYIWFTGKMISVFPWAFWLSFLCTFELLLAQISFYEHAFYFGYFLFVCLLTSLLRFLFESLIKRLAFVLVWIRNTGKQNPT